MVIRLELTTQRAVFIGLGGRLCPVWIVLIISMLQQFAIVRFGAVKAVVQPVSINLIVVFCHVAMSVWVV